MTFYDKYFIKKQLKAYIISLHKPELLFNTLQNNHITPILVEGIDGKNLTPDIKNKNATYLFSNFGSNNSIAIGMSHIKAWKKILASKEPYGIVFEDDVILTNNFYDNFMTHLKKLPKDYDLFYLGCFGCQNNFNPLNIAFNLLGFSYSEFKNINNYINQPSTSLGLHAYVISKNGIKKLLKLLDGKLYFHIDVCIQLLARNKEINVYSPKIRLAYQESTNKAISSNIENNTPIILNKFLSNFYIDEKCKLNYVTTVTLFKLNEFNLTISSLIIILLGYYLGSFDYDFYHVSFFYLILSIPDLLNINNIFIKIHYLLFIISFLLRKKIYSINN